MKKLLLFILLSVAISTQSMAQDAKEPGKSYIYCEIVGTSKFLSNKVTISLDFGQFNKFASDQRLVDEDGKPVVFNSMVDAMNWMGADGWEFMQAYVITGQTALIYHWLLKLDLELLTPEEKADVLSKFKTRKMFKDANKTNKQ